MTAQFGGYATLTSRNLDPAECNHERRTAYDSHRCLDCRQDVGPGDDRVDSSDLTPLQYVVLELVAARYRLGHNGWTLESRVKRTVDQLANLGLVHYKSGTMPKTVLVWLTEAGKKASLSEDYVAPILKGEAAVRLVLADADVNGLDDVTHEFAEGYFTALEKVEAAMADESA